jgi:GH35 family endo-1,4-beta-xylanase
MKFPSVVLMLVSPLALALPTCGRAAELSYRGREPTAPWRAAAEARIERARKGGLQVKVVDDAGKPVPGAAVTVTMKRHAFGFGAAVTARLLSIDTADARKYREIVEQNYNKVVFENDLKWRPWEVGESESHRAFRRSWVETALAWLNKRKIEVRGHYITWAPLKPDEVERYGKQPALLRRELFSHIEKKVPQVGARVGEWDAVNHIVGWGTTLSDVLGGDAIYAEIIRRSRRLAPHAELWINEGQILPGGSRRDAYERMARFLAKEGAAPDGIGFMGHFSRRSLTPPGENYATLERFAALNAKLQLTELDVDVGQDENLQADYLRDVMIVAFSQPAVEAIVMWGFWEGRHWKPNAALYRRDWSLKPAGRVWRELVFERWWTKTGGKTDRRGSFTTRGFLGDYEIAVKGASKSVKGTLRKEGTTMTVVVD